MKHDDSSTLVSYSWEVDELCSFRDSKQLAHHINRKYRIGYIKAILGKSYKSYHKKNSTEYDLTKWCQDFMKIQHFHVCL